MDPRQYWLQQIRYFSIKTARCLSHIEFIGSCLRVGIIPPGLTLQFPIHAAPPAMRSNILSFSRSCSSEYTKLILHQYQRLHGDYLNKHLVPLLNVVRMVGGDVERQANMILDHAEGLLHTFRSNHLRKLSALYVRHLQSGHPLQLRTARRRPHPHTRVYTEQPRSECAIHHPSEPTNQPAAEPVIPHTDESMHDVIGEPDNLPASPSNENVCNLSSRTLSEIEEGLLSKGLTFTPTPRPDHIKLHEDIQEFCWQLRIKYFWHTNAEQIASEQPHPSLRKFKPPSNFDPRLSGQSRLPPTHPLERYISQLLQRTSSGNFLDSLTPRDNLTPAERQALKGLKADQAIKIMPADKGSTVVIMNSTDYDQEALRQLSDTRFYDTIDRDPTSELAVDIRAYIRRNGRREGLSFRDMEILVPENPQCPDFYLLPKIHKPYSLPDQLPPGRPIVASFGCATERISAYVDSHLQDIVQNQPSFIKDTQHFLNVLRETNISGEVILATIDVNSLYTEIPHNEGLHALTHFLQERPDPRIPSTDFLVKLAECVLNMNVFKFKDQMYIQKRGTAMGTRMAPSYANLFMAYLENSFLASKEKRPIMWKRFIDDIFMVWPHSEEELQSFLGDLNSRYSVTFTWSYSRLTATFLDVDVMLTDGGFSTSVHVKPTNKQLYLHYDSCHPPHTKRAIPRSLSIRGHRICSEATNLESYLTGVQNKLAGRGYPRRFLNDRMVPAHVNYQQRPKASTDRVSLVTTFFFGAQKMNGILRELQTVLASSPLTRDVFGETPRVAYRQGKSIGELLSHRHPRPQPTQPQQFGLRACGRARCKLCNLVIEGPHFTSPNTRHVYTCRDSSECQSRSCVYQLVCKKCTDAKAFYVGKATALNLRMNNHRASVNQPRPLPIKLHANSHDATFDECFGVQVLRKMPESSNDRLLQQSERAHMLVLGALRPPGLNLND